MPASSDRPTIVSYAAAGVSGLLIAVLLGYLLAAAYGPTAPPRIRAAIVAQHVRQEDGHSYVPVEVRNDGEEAATRVVLEIAPQGGEAGLETVVEYLAGGESQRIVALVPDTVAAAFRVRVVSYQEP